MEDDYLLEDDEELIEDGFYGPQDAPKPSDDDDDSDSSSDSDDEKSSPNDIDVSKYKNKLTKREAWLITAYDDVVAAGKKSENAILDAAYTVVSANPRHTSQSTISLIVNEMFGKQGHSRMSNSIYTPDTPLKGEDLDIDLDLDEDYGFNRVFAEEAREQIARFIDYLANRDLSKDSVVSKKRKQRQIPAFIIFLFSSGMYDLVINCPTMPKVYQDQISRAMEEITKAKYDVVEELARKYEDLGRQKVADRVRKMQLAWFVKEPAEIRTSSEYSDLDLTYDDVVVYREYRGRFTNTSKAITQDVISDYIEVVIDEEAGVYEKLKDKTRSDAIADVKQVYKEWAKNNTPVDSEVASRVIWKDMEPVINN